MLATCADDPWSAAFGSAVSATASFAGGGICRAVHAKRVAATASGARIW
jgi:hypothetical protein